MGKLTGLLMIVAGVGTAAYVYPMFAPEMGTGADKAERQLADVVTITTPGVANPQRTAGADPIAPPVRIIAATKNQTGDTPFTSARSATTNAATVSGPTLPTAPQPAVRPLADATKVLQQPPQPAKRNRGDDERTTLTRAIQSELRRVGCLQADADGTWNTATRQAMKTFIDRVNATLPIDEPDHILKTLVQGHPGNACGKSCPSGQTAAADGRCLPTAIMTQGPTPARRPAADLATSATTSGPQRQADASASPATASKSVQSATSSWETITTPAVTSPSVAAAVGAAAAVAASTLANAEPRRTELPGRMSVGGQTPEAASTVEPPKSRFVVKQKERVATVNSAPASPAASEPAAKTKEEPSERASSAVKASPPEPPAPRRASPPPQREAAYRAPPPPRYVGAYVPAPVRVARPRFGPQIFRQLEISGR